MKSTFHQSLISLSVFEIAFLVLVILDHSLDFNSPAYIVLFPYFLHPMKNILMSCETYLYYVHWTRFILTLAIPFVFLVSVNTAIYVRIRQNLTSLVVIHQDSCRY